MLFVIIGPFYRYFGYIPKSYKILRRSYVAVVFSANYMNAKYVVKIESVVVTHLSLYYPILKSSVIIAIGYT